MATTPATARAASYTPLAILGSLAGILAIAGVLAVAASSVRDSTKREQAETMSPGNISVVGAAKVLEWSGAGASIQVPVGWTRIADGQTDTQCTRAGTATCERAHIWQAGVAGLNGTPGDRADCDTSAVCVRLRSFLPTQDFVSSGRAPIRGDASGDLNRVWRFALENQRAQVLARTDLSRDERNAQIPRFLDGGGVTARGGRWVTRVYAQVGDSIQTSYFFPTCRPAGPGETARVDRYWELRLIAPDGAVPTKQFDAIVGSLETELPSPARDSDCSATVRA